MNIKKIAFVIGTILYMGPAFAKASYYFPLGASFSLPSDFPPKEHTDYAKLNFFIRVFNHPGYAAWIEMGALHFRTITHNSVNLNEIGIAGRYHCLPQGVLGAHLFGVFDCLLTHTHLQGFNPGIEWTFLKYRTALYAHTNIPLSPKEEFWGWECVKRQWGGEIVIKTDIPAFALGPIPIPNTKLTTGLYGNQYIQLTDQGNLKFPWGFLARLEIQVLRFLSITLHKDQLTPMTFGIKLHYGWQANHNKPMPYYLYNPFDRYLAYHLDTPRQKNKSRQANVSGTNQHHIEMKDLTTSELDPLKEECNR